MVLAYCKQRKAVVLLDTLSIYLQAYMRVFGFQSVKVGGSTERLTKNYDNSA